MATWDTDDNGEIVWAKTSAGRQMEIHVASGSLQKRYAKLSRDPEAQREYREGCDEAELGGRVAKHLRVENYPRLDRR
jgi:hypothetical protein